MSNKKRAIIILFIVTALWGLTFPLIKNAVANIAPLEFVTIRFLLAAIVLLPFIIKEIKQNNYSLLIAGICLGVLNSAVYATQTIGLQTISSAQAAFIVGMNVIFIPFLAAFFKVGAIKIIDVITAIICVIGLFIFTNFAIRFHIGSLWCLFSAISIAASIVYLQFITTKKTISSFKLLAFYQILFTAPIPAVFSANFSSLNYFINIHVLIAILFCAIFATSIALLLQTKYQRYVDTTKVALIYSLEPVFAALFAFIINKELITLNMLLGGIIMLLGLVLHVVVSNRIKV